MYIFILGLDHSRSTIIDVALGQKFGGLSLGEVRRTAFPRGGEAGARVDCSCGAGFADCSVWQRLAQDFEAEAKALMGEGRVLIDSSKDIKHYRQFAGRLTPHVTVVTYRKFDDWYRSITAAAARDNSFSFKGVFRDRHFVLAALRLYLRRFRFVARLEWVLTHLRFLRAVKGPAILVTQDSDIDRLSALIPVVEGTTEKHIVRGNRVSRQGDAVLQAFDESDGFAGFLKKRIEKHLTAESLSGAAE